MFEAPKNGRRVVPVRTQKNMSLLFRPTEVANFGYFSTVLSSRRPDIGLTMFELLLSILHRMRIYLTNSHFFLFKEGVFNSKLLESNHE